MNSCVSHAIRSSSQKNSSRTTSSRRSISGMWEKSWKSWSCLRRSLIMRSRRKWLKRRTSQSEKKPKRRLRTVKIQIKRKKRKCRKNKKIGPCFIKISILHNLPQIKSRSQEMRKETQIKTKSWNKNRLKRSLPTKLKMRAPRQKKKRGSKNQKIQDLKHCQEKKKRRVEKGRRKARGRLIS